MSASSTKISIIPRTPAFVADEIPLHWVYGDAFCTHFGNVMHLALPAGERWFCRLYAKTLPFIEDDKLREDVRAFIRQEAHHARVHTAMATLLQQQGLKPDEFVRYMDWLFEQVAGDHPFGRLWHPALDRPWLKLRLGVITAIEHFTGVLGDWMMNADYYENDDLADAEMLAVLRWHGAEEVEHRNVAFDLHRHLCSSDAAAYSSRQLSMLIVAPAMALVWIQGMRHLFKHDCNGPGRPHLRQWFDAGRTGRLPGPVLLAKSVVRYLKPRYHPEYEANTAQALSYLAQFETARAAS